MVEGGVMDGAYDVMQLPDDNVHDAGSNVPPAPLSLHDTVPVVARGRAWKPKLENLLFKCDVSLIWADNVIELPVDTVAEFGVIVVLVGSGVLDTGALEK